MKLKAAFIFLAPEADKDAHRTTIDTPAVELTTIGVANYDKADILAAELVKEGIGAIELCGGFGSEGVARISKIAGDNVAVGVVRFDKHPGLNHQTGDALFS